MNSHSISPSKTANKSCTLLHIKPLTGGGKIRPAILRFRHIGWRKQLVWLFVPLFLCLIGCSKPKKMICGVPVQGTPWELAAAIADHGDGSFTPECVQYFSKEQDSIEGWYYSDSLGEDVRAELVCELDTKGQVVDAFLIVNDEIIE